MRELDRISFEITAATGSAAHTNVTRITDGRC